LSPTSADGQIRPGWKRQPEALTKKEQQHGPIGGSTYREAHIDFSKNPRHKVCSRKCKIATLCCFTTDAADDVHEQGAKAAICLNKHGHEGVAGIFPEPILGDLGCVAMCCIIILLHMFHKKHVLGHVKSISILSLHELLDTYRSWAYLLESYNMP
jgi:hypothetical protein